MNITNAVHRREIGFEPIRDYNIALYRLTCYRDNVYRGITPNADAPDFNPEPPVFACRFSTKQDHEHILALANEDGKLALQDTRSKRKDNQSLAGAQVHCNAIFDIAWMPDELKLVTVSGDHTAQLWDVSKGIRHLRCFHAHTRSVKTAIFRDRDKAVFATGARDGSIMVWDIRASQPRPDNWIANAHNVNAHNMMKRKTVAQTSRMQSITSLVFQDDFTLISCAAGDGSIKVWDLRKTYTAHRKEPIAKHCMNYAGTSSKYGFSSLLMCPAKIKLYASCMDNNIYAYNISSYNRQPVVSFYGHQNLTFYIKTCLSSDGRYLVSGSSDKLAYIWHTNRPGLPLVKLHGHTEEVTCVSWYSKNDIKLVTCSDDYTYRVWTIGCEDKADNENRPVSGKAEVVLENFPVGHPKLETTSTIKCANCNQETTPNSNTTPVKTPGNKSSNHHGDKLNPFKRTYQQMMGESEEKFNSILSPIHENHEMIFIKRAYVGNSGGGSGARKLSSRENIVNSSRGYDSDEPSTSQSGSIDDRIPFSPTSNLPNFVLDGTAPHLLELSPQKCKENVDWLTKMRKERYERGTSIHKTQVTPGRRSSRSRSTEPQKITKSARSTLLDFFKAAGKDREANPRLKDGFAPSTSSDDSIVPSTSLDQRQQMVNSREIES